LTIHFFVGCCAHYVNLLPQPDRTGRQTGTEGEQPLSGADHKDYEDGDKL